ncbi:MAG: ankyrin repeat domain-containing protein [Pseudomonadota bacterium]
MRTEPFYLTLTGCLVFLAGFVTIDTSYAKDLTPSEVRQYVRSTYKAVKGTDAFLDGALNKAGPVEGLAWLDIFKLLITADKVAEAVQAGNYHKAIIVAGSYGAVEATLRASQVARTYSATYSMVQLAALPIELGLKSFERTSIKNAWNYQIRRYFAARKMGKSPDFIMAGKSDDDVLFDDFRWIYSVGVDGGRKGLPQHMPAGYTPQSVYTAAEKLYGASLRAQQFSSERGQMGENFLASLNNNVASATDKESVGALTKTAIASSNARNTEAPREQNKSAVAPSTGRNAAVDTRTKAFLKAIREKNTQMVKLLIEDGVDVNSSDNQFTALSLAARLGNIEIAKILLAHGAKVSDTPTHTIPPVIAAADYKDLGMLKLMVTHGADVNTKLGNIDILRKSDTTGPGTTALMVAVHAMDPRPANVDFLLSKGTDPNTVNQAGLTALHIAIRVGGQAMQRHSLDRRPEVLRQEQERRRQYLHIIRTLLDHGADPTIKNAKVSSPAEWALEIGDAELYQLVKNHGKK